MKRNIIRLTLAVVISLTLILGTAGYAGAANYIDVNEGTMELQDQGGGNYKLYATANVYGVRVKHYVVEWKYKEGVNWISLGRTGYTLSTAVRNSPPPLALYGPTVDSSYCGKEFAVYVYKTSRTFKVNTKRGWASQTVTLTCS